jgi:hypothetical protein
MVVLLVLGFIAGLFGIVAAASAAQRKAAIARADNLRDFGHPLGMNLIDQVIPNGGIFNTRRTPINFDPRKEYPGIDFFRMHNCTITNELEGKDDQGRRIRSFDAQYTVSTGKSSVTYYYTLATIELRCPVPEMTVAHEGLWDRVKEFFGHHDVVVGNEEFDKKFRINCPDEAFVRSLLMSEMQDRFLHQGPWSFYLTGNQLVLMKSSLAQPTELGEMLNEGAFIADRIEQPETLSQVRYALHHASAPVSEVEEQVQEEL